MKDIIYKRIVKIGHDNIDLNFLIKLCKDLKIIKNNLEGDDALEKIYEIDEIIIKKGDETSIITFIDNYDTDSDSSEDMDIDSDVEINDEINKRIRRIYQLEQ